MSKNPFNKDKQETEYSHWEAGFSAQSEAECPYEKDVDDEESVKLRSLWMRGFKAKRKNSRTAAKDKQQEFQPMGTLEQFNTQDLEAELMKRKAKELEDLLKQKAELDRKVAKLQALFGE